MVQVWYMFGISMVQLWYKYVTAMVQVWYNYRTSMVPAWCHYAITGRFFDVRSAVQYCGRHFLASAIAHSYKLQLIRLRFIHIYYVILYQYHAAAHATAACKCLAAQHMLSASLTPHASFACILHSAFLQYLQLHDCLIVIFCCLYARDRLFTGVVLRVTCLHALL